MQRKNARLLILICNQVLDQQHNKFPVPIAAQNRGPWKVEYQSLSKIK